MNVLRRRDLLYGLGGAVAAASLAGVPAMGAPQAGADALALVDPELRSALGPQSSLDLSLAQMTAPLRRGPGGRVLPAPAPQPVVRAIPGARGAPEVRVIVIDPGRAARPRPAILFIHGGGYVMGRADGSVTLLQQLAQELGCLAVSVDYRLAPETHFPGSLEDNYAALKWLHAQAEALGIDRRRIAVGGSSAGGGHAAMLAIAARDRGELAIAFQLLIYPMLDDRTASTRAAAPHVGRFIWTPADNRVGWRALLGVEPGSSAVPPGAAPARVRDLAGLPPAFIGVGGIDLFVDEDIEYARRLVAAKVPTELLVVPGAYHAFDVIAPQSGVARRFTAEWKRALARAFQG